MINQPFTRPGEQEDLVHRAIFKILLGFGLFFGLLLIVAYSVPALLIAHDENAEADAAVVLFGPHYDARVHAAAKLFQAGKIKAVVINGDRRSALVEREIGASLPAYASWDSRYRAILSAMGVPDKAVHSFSLTQAYDSRTEARALATQIARLDIRSIIIVTDQYHTGRSRRIWENVAGNRLSIFSHGSQLQGDNPDSWWQRPNEIKRVLVEFGGYLFGLVT